MKNLHKNSFQVGNNPFKILKVTLLDLKTKFVKNEPFQSFKVWFKMNRESRFILNQRVVQKTPILYSQREGLLIPFNGTMGGTNNKFRASRVPFEGASSALIFTRKYKGF